MLCLCDLYLCVPPPEGTSHRQSVGACRCEQTVLSCKKKHKKQQFFSPNDCLWNLVYLKVHISKRHKMWFGVEDDSVISDWCFATRNEMPEQIWLLCIVIFSLFFLLLLIILSPCKTKVAVWFIVSQHVADIFLIEGVVKGLLYFAHLTRNTLHIRFCYISTCAVWDTSHTAENSPVWPTFMLAACIRGLPALLRTQCQGLGLWPGILNSLCIFWFVIRYWIYAYFWCCHY